MTKKLFILVNTIIIATSTITTAIIAYLDPQNYIIATSAAAIVTAAATDLMVLFVKDKENNEG